MEKRSDCGRWGLEELEEVDVIGTSRPILAAYLDPPSELFLRGVVIRGIPSLWPGARPPWDLEPETPNAEPEASWVRLYGESCAVG